MSLKRRVLEAKRKFAESMDKDDPRYWVLNAVELAKSDFRKEVSAAEEEVSAASDKLKRAKKRLDALDAIEKQVNANKFKEAAALLDTPTLDSMFNAADKYGMMQLRSALRKYRDSAF